MSSYINIYNLLKNNKKIAKFDDENGEEADRIAHSLIDIKDSFKDIYEKYVPLLENGNLNESKIDDVLLDIGEEFRHILYHIADMKYYNYLQDLSD